MEISVNYKKKTTKTKKKEEEEKLRKYHSHISVQGQDWHWVLLIWGQHWDNDPSYDLKYNFR